MQYGSIDSLIRVLKNRETEEKESILATAQQEYDSFYEKNLQEAKQKAEQRNNNFTKDMVAKRQREEAHIKHEKEWQLNSYREELIDSAMKRCKEYFYTLSEDEYIKSIKICLEQSWVNKNLDTTPILFVPEKYYKCATDAFKNIASVQTNPEIKSGFILSFPDYNINRETDQLFAFYENEFRSTLIDQCLIKRSCDSGDETK